MIVVLSIDFKTAPIALLEKVSCNKDDMTHYLSTLLGTLFFDEMVIISTCNRTEWVFTSPHPQKAVSILHQKIHALTGIATSILSTITTLYHHNSALRHLHELACGLKSMVIGESEILTQIKQGHAFCMEFGATRAHLNKVFQSIIATGKEARTKTQISAGAHSISSIGIEAIKQHNPNFLNEPMLLIGSGMMIQRALVKLSAMGHSQLTIANRTMSRVDTLAETIPHIQVIPFATVRHQFHQFRTLYIAISSKEPFIRCCDIGHIDHALTIIDLGIPRNVSPDCGTLASVTLVGVAELEAISNQTIQTRKNDIEPVMRFIDNAISELHRWDHYRSEKKLCQPLSQYA